MTNKKTWLGILVIVLVFGMTVAGCGKDDDSTNNPQTVSYEGTDVSGNIYTLTVTEKTDRAVYAPVAGDSYELTIKKTSQPNKISRGIVEKTSIDGTFTLQPSVTGSGTFNVVISDAKISSVVGDITVDGGEIITARSFSTIYLRAFRWARNSGESIGSGDSIKLSDFYSGTLKDNTNYTIKISGTVDNTTVDLNHIRVEINNHLFKYIYGTSMAEISGDFELSWNKQKITNQEHINNLKEAKEIYVSLNNIMWQINESTGAFIHNYGDIPDDISDFTIMATIKNFNISLVEE